MEMNSAAFITLNPSIGTTYFASGFRTGATNRCVGPSVKWADGKAAIAARAYRRLGGTAKVLYPSGGEVGGDLTRLLEQDGVYTYPVPISGRTRETLSVSDVAIYPPSETELLELGPDLSPSERSHLIDAAIRLCCNTPTCAISGSLPGNCPREFYSDLIAAIKHSSPGCLVLLDTSGDALKTAISSGVDILKVNYGEFCDLANIAFDAAPIDAVVGAMRALCIDAGIRWVIVTRGRQTVLAVGHSGEQWEAFVPEVVVKNTIGAGDCFTAGLLWDYSNGISDAILTAIASGCATVIGTTPGEITPQNVNSIRCLAAVKPLIV